MPPFLDWLRQFFDDNPLLRDCYLGWHIGWGMGLTIIAWQAG